MGKQNRLIVAGFERSLRRILGAGQPVGNKGMPTRTGWRPERSIQSPQARRPGMRGPLRSGVSLVGVAPTSRFPVGAEESAPTLARDSGIRHEHRFAVLHHLADFRPNVITR